MVAMLNSCHYNRNGPLERAEQLLSEVEALIGDFGGDAFKEAALRSSAGNKFDREGGLATLAVIQELSREISFDEDPQLQAEIVALSSGTLIMNDQTMTRVGQKHGVTKAAISKRVIAFCDKWKLPPSEFMRSKKDRRTYALTNKPRVT